MVNTFERPQRTEVMRRVRRRDTGPELQLRRALWERGCRYRIDYKVASMKVDIAFPGKRWAVFVDGCFWHGCPEHYVAPVNNAWAWRAKLARNRARDGRNDIELTGLGWSVVRVWTHELGARTGEVADRILGRLAGDVHGGQT